MRLSAHADEPVATRFSLWSIAGRKNLVHDGRRLLLTDSELETIRRVGVDPELSHGMRYGYLVPSGHRLSQYRDALGDAIALVTHPHVLGHWLPRPQRDAMLSMRTLQGLDAAEVGTSHRAIASVIFGEPITSQRWTPDGELRAQVRHLLRRGRYLRDGGYRSLLRQAGSPTTDE